jgi:hypothetical protein
MYSWMGLGARRLEAALAKRYSAPATTSVNHWVNDKPFLPAPKRYTVPPLHYLTLVSRLVFTNPLLVAVRVQAPTKIFLRCSPQMSLLRSPNNKTD